MSHITFSFHDVYNQGILKANINSNIKAAPLYSVLSAVPKCIAMYNTIRRLPKTPQELGGYLNSALNSNGTNLNADGY